MIETKLLVGRYLEFTPTPHRQQTAPPPAFIPVLCPPLTIQESARLEPGAKYNPFKNVGGARTSDVVAGTNTDVKKAHRNFKWLPWYEGDISTTVLDCDVLTGPMSGCILVSYFDGAVPKVAHIGTVTVTSTEFEVVVPESVNTNVKAVWTDFAKAHPGQVVGGFDPVDRALPPHPRAQGDDVKGETWGLFSSTGEFYSVQVWIQKGHIHRYRVAAVHQVPSMSLQQLQNI